jgi:hypothetical protein
MACAALTLSRLACVMSDAEGSAKQGLPIASDLVRWACVQEPRAPAPKQNPLIIGKDYKISGLHPGRDALGRDALQSAPDGVALATSKGIDASAATPERPEQTVVKHCMSARVSPQWADGGEEDEHEPRNTAAMMVETGIRNAVASEFKAQTPAQKFSLALLMLRLVVSAEDGQPYIHSCEAGHTFVCTCV